MTRVELARTADGAVALRGDEEAARLTAELRDEPWPGQAWLTATGERALFPDLYALAGDAWVRAGYVSHQVVVEAGDAAQLDLWYGLCFGRQQVYASRPTAGAEPYEGPVRVRIGPDEDAALALLDVLPERLLGPPVWAPQPSHEELVEGWREFLADPRTIFFVGELDGTAAGYLALAAAGDGSTNLEVAATLPELRGRGVMSALTAAGLAWAAANGFERCDTDWRSTNLEAARFWPARGFRPTRYRLHRLVGR